MSTLKRLVVSCAVLVLCTAPADAQTRARRGFVTLNAAAQAAAAEMTDRHVFQANAEAGSVETRYPARTAVLLDGGIGFRFSRRVGAAIALSRATTSGRAAVSARVPHPLHDDQDRLVDGEANDLTWTETAAHLQLFYELPSATRWRVHLFAGPSYVNREQALVREVLVNETYPFDTATFQSALTGPAKGSGIGINLGADISWMFGRRTGAGLLLRYTRASLDLNAPDSRIVSSDGSGLQAGAGLRFTF